MKWLFIGWLLTGMALAETRMGIDQAPSGVTDAAGYVATVNTKEDGWASGFTRLREPATAAREATRFRIALGKEHLFFYAKAEESRALPSEVGFKPGGKLWKRDSLELLIQTGRDTSSAWQLIVTADGEMAGRRLLQFGIMSEPWVSHAKISTQKGEREWSLAAAIPLAALTPDPERKTWRLQVARNRPAREGEEPEISVWAPASGALNDFDTFGTATVPPTAELRTFAWRLEDQGGSGRIIHGEEGYRLERQIAVTNDSGVYRSVTLESTLADGTSQARQTLNLPPGRTRQVLLAYPLGERSKVEGPVEDRIISDTLLAVQNGAVAAAYQPWRLELLDPGYRGIIFASQKFDTVRARFSRIDPALGVANLTGQLKGESVDLPATVRQEGANQWEMDVAGVAALEPGEYELLVQGESESGPFTIRQPVSKLPAQKGEVWIDALGVVHRDGKPFSGYGFFFGGAGRVAHFPGIHTNIFGPVSPKGEMLEEIEKNAEKGILSMVYVAEAGPRGLTRGQGATPLTTKEKETFRKLAETLRGNANLFAYYLWDEPELHDIHPSRLREIYEILREADPYKPVVIINNTLYGVRDYLGACDISMPDPYSWFLTGGGSALSLDIVGKYLNEISLGAPSLKARWVTPQAFDGEYFGRSGNRGPTAEEMRTQQVSALIAGAAGVVWYPSYLAVDEPGVNASITYLSHEFDWLFGWRTQRLPRLVADGKAAFLEGEPFPVLLGSNTAWEPTEIVVKDDLLAAHPRWMEVGTGEMIETVGGTLLLKRAPHQSGVWIPAGADRPTGLDWSAVLDREKTLWAAAVGDPRNVAHRSKGGVARLITPKGEVKRVIAWVDGVNIPPSEGGRGYHERGNQAGAQVEVELAKPARVKEVRIHHTTLAKGSLEARVKGQWIDQGVFQAHDGFASIPLDLGDRRADAVRVNVKGINTNRLVIHEIEVLE